MSGWRERVAVLLARSLPETPVDRTTPAVDAPCVITAKIAKSRSVELGPARSGDFGGFGTRSVLAAEHLSSLAINPPPNVAPEPWRQRLQAAASFATAWGDIATALGWTEGELYGLHPSAPLTRLDAMGAAYCTFGREVVAVTANAVVLSVPPIARLQRARKPTLAAPPAWETVGEQALVQTISENLSRGTRGRF